MWRTLRTECSEIPKSRKTLHFAKKTETIIGLEYNLFSNFETIRKLSHHRVSNYWRLFVTVGLYSPFKLLIHCPMDGINNTSSQV